MSIQISNKEYEEDYNEFYSEAKAKGLSDRDADIVATKKIYPASTLPLADHYNISPSVVRKIFLDYF